MTIPANVVRGEKHVWWKGDDAKPHAKRRRSHIYPLGDCQGCGEKATDRHHVNGDVGDNSRENIRMLCRKCHMSEDGRLIKLTVLCKDPLSVFSDNCINCGNKYKPLRHGRCEKCSDYFRRTGQERPDGPRHKNGILLSRPFCRKGHELNGLKVCPICYEAKKARRRDRRRIKLGAAK